MARCFSVKDIVGSPATSSSSDSPRPLVVHKHYDTTHSQKSLRRMLSCFNSKRLCDIQLIASKGHIICAHKLVLIGGSDYFESMFTGALQESQQSVVHLNEIDGNSLELLVKFCYTGKITITRENILSVLETANYLLMSEVVLVCFSCFPRVMDTTNCFNIVAIADVYGSQPLRNVAKGFICKNFMEVSQSEEFLLLTNKNLMEWLTTKNLVVSDEDYVFERVLAWCLHDRPQREKHLPGLLEVLNLYLVSSTHLSNLSTNFPDVAKKSSILSKALDETDKQAPTSQNKIARKYTYIHADVLVALGGVDLDGDLGNMVEVYNTETDCWFDYMSIHDELQAKVYFTAVPINYTKTETQILLVGGRRETEAMSDVQLLDLKTKSIKNVSHMNTPRVFHQTVVVHTHNEFFVFALGGCNDDFVSLASVERWDPQSDTWSFVASMHKPRKFFGATVLKGKLYVSGNLGRCIEMEVYDLNTNVWTMCSSMLSGHIQLLTAGDYIYGIGGKQDVSSIDRYDPETDTWTKFIDLPTEWCEISSCVYKEEIVICGGKNLTAFELPREVKALNLQSSTWRNLGCTLHSRLNGIFLSLPYELGNGFVKDESYYQ